MSDDSYDETVNRESERRWDELLEKLADEALAEHEAGLTEVLDPDTICE